MHAKLGMPQELLSKRWLISACYQSQALKVKRVHMLHIECVVHLAQVS